MKNINLVLLRDANPTNGFAEYCFRDYSGKPLFIQECKYPCRYCMPGLRKDEMFKADSLNDLINMLWDAEYIIYDPFNLITRERLYDK